MNIRTEFYFLFFLAFGLQARAFDAPHLMKNPAAVLNKVMTLQEAYNKEQQQIIGQVASSSSDVTTLRTNLKALLQKHAEKCPIFLLGECTREGSYPCSLSRLQQPTARTHFENRVARALVEKSASESDQPIQYTSFGSGGMFQDLVILTKTLSQKPKSKIILHIIDQKNTPYVNCRDLIGNGREVSTTTAIDPEPVIEEFMEQVRKNIDGTMSDETLRKQLILMPMMNELPAQQMLSYLQKYFTQAKIALHMHDTVDSYLGYLKRFSIPYPDVVSTADVEDGMSLMRGSVQAYEKLCKETLKHKPHNKNFWLGKALYTSTAQIHSYTLDTENTDKLVVKTETLKPEPQRLQTVGNWIWNNKTLCTAVLSATYVGVSIARNNNWLSFLGY